MEWDVKRFSGTGSHCMVMVITEKIVLYWNFMDVEESSWQLIARNVKVNSVLQSFFWEEQKTIFLIFYRK